MPTPPVSLMTNQDRITFTECKQAYKPECAASLALSKAQQCTGFNQLRSVVRSHGRQNLTDESAVIVDSHPLTGIIPSPVVM